MSEEEKITVDISELTLGDLEKLLAGSEKMTFAEQLEIIDHCLVGKTARQVKIKQVPLVMQAIEEAVKEQANPTLGVPVNGSVSS